MRKLFLLISGIMILTSALFNFSLAGDRKVLVERFTSSTCPPCATNNPTLDAFLASSDPNKITSISYHMNWPAPGNDPMYAANPNDNNARRTQYGVNSIPDWFFDGTISMLGGSNAQLQNAFNARTGILSPVTIVVSETRNGNTVNVKADIYTEIALSNPNAVVHFGVIEKVVYYNGTNGETFYNDVMRKMLPSGAGTPVILMPGRTIRLEFTYNIESSWVNPISNMVFVQGFNGEIYNCATLTNDFNLISAPAYKVVNQGQAQNADYKIKIPSVVNNYNSPVTFTAEVSPATAGITASFTGGNVISNYPDSININVSSTGAVAAGVYQIIVTGTNTNGKVHKTVFNYLVGQNYGIVGTNRTQPTFKVDNVSYTTPQLFTWNIGSSHTLEAVSPLQTGNTRYEFVNWNNGGPIVQTVNVGTQETIFTAFYKVQYKLLSSFQPAAIPATINGGNVFYDSGSSANISVTPHQVQYNGMTYYFQRWEGSGNGSYTGNNPTPSIQVNNILLEKAIYDTINVGITNYSSVVPDKFSLYQNYPNPFNPTTNIKFDIAKSSFTSIIVYDVLGKEVSRLVNENLNAGKYEYSFDASNYSSGIYYYKIVTNSFTDIKKMLLVK